MVFTHQIRFDSCQMCSGLTLTEQTRAVTEGFIAFPVQAIILVGGIKLLIHLILSQLFFREDQFSVYDRDIRAHVSNDEEGQLFRHPKELGWSLHKPRVVFARGDEFKEILTSQTRFRQKIVDDLLITENYENGSREGLEQSMVV